MQTINFKSRKDLPKIFFLGLCVGTFLSFLMFFNYVSFQEKGIAWNRFTGDLWLQDAGMHMTYPWVMVTTVDTRPMRVCIESSVQASRKCKLVRFVPEYYQDLVALTGHQYYWLNNRLSFNSGYQEEYRGFRDIMHGFAFSDTPYAFIKEESEY